MTITDYVTLGRSGLRVSPFCLGAMTFGDEWSLGAGVEESVAVLETYLERGGNFIDTANIYTKGHSEAILGDYFAASPARPRDRIVIATKFMSNLHPDDPNGGGASRKAILHQCEDSLRRLRTDYIDLYWCHFHDPHTPIDETMATLDTLVKSGKIRYIGFSDTPAWVCVQAQYEAIFRSWTPLVALQIEYSLIQRTVEADLMPMARANGMGVTPWGPLRAGILSGKYRRDSRPEPGTTRVPVDSRYLTDKTYGIIDALVAIAADLNATPAQVALRWLQDRVGVTSTILGARRRDQLLDNLGALEIELDAAQTARLDEASEPTLPFPHEFLSTVKNVSQGGVTVNGQTSERPEILPANDGERW